MWPSSYSVAVEAGSGEGTVRLNLHSSYCQISRALAIYIRLLFPFIDWLGISLSKRGRHGQCLF